MSGSPRQIDKDFLLCVNGAQDHVRHSHVLLEQRLMSFCRTALGTPEVRGWWGLVLRHNIVVGVLREIHSILMPKGAWCRLPTAMQCWDDRGGFGNSSGTWKGNSCGEYNEMLTCQWRTVCCWVGTHGQRASTWESPTWGGR